MYYKIIKPIVISLLTLIFLLIFIKLNYTYLEIQKNRKEIEFKDFAENTIIYTDEYGNLVMYEEREYSSDVTISTEYEKKYNIVTIVVTCNNTNKIEMFKIINIMDSMMEGWMKDERHKYNSVKLTEQSIGYIVNKMEITSVFKLYR